MGIVRGMVHLLLAETRKDPFSGTILQLGRQRLYFSAADLQAWARTHGVALAELPVGTREPRPTQGDDDRFDDIAFFSALGFSDVQSCDISGYQGSTHIVDLNEPVPSSMHGQYDVVLDSGTTEHIFDPVAVFRNIHDMLKVGGRVIHISPSTGHVDHGFYMYSPTLFHQYYAVNGCTIETSYVYKYAPLAPSRKGSWTVYDYQPGSLYWARYSFRGALGVFFVARKTAASTGGVRPQQGSFARSWNVDRESGDPIQPSSLAGADSTGPQDLLTDETAGSLTSYLETVATRRSRSRSALLGRLKEFAKRYSVVFRLLLWVRRALPFGKMPPFVARY